MIKQNIYYIIYYIIILTRRITLIMGISSRILNVKTMFLGTLKIYSDFQIETLIFRSQHLPMICTYLLTSGGELLVL